jgi:hypothetical protein
MHQGVQQFQLCFIMKDNSGQMLAIDLAIGRENLRAEHLDDGLVGFPAPQQNGVAQIVSPQHATTEAAQFLSHNALAGCDAAG